MKVAIITLHRVYNFGSVLQAYATQKVIEKNGAKAKIIDYITPQRTFKRILFQKASNYGLIKSCIYYTLKFFSLLIKELTFGTFIKKNIKLTKKYVTVDDLIKDPPEADVYITGSDQTWNSNYNEGIDKGFFLGFVPNNKKKVSFVSSFGKTKLDNYEINETKKFLDNYAAISVRENSAVEIVKSLHINNVTQLIDPTLQLTKDEWVKIASKRLVKEKYLILMLLYNEDNGATDYARKIADEKNLKLVKISWELKKPKKVDKLFTHRSPADFLSLFANADFVVTNSFHGLAFSINLHRDFIVVPRNEYNSRIESLLELVNLNDRLVMNVEEAKAVSKKDIDYIQVENVLNDERRKANSFIVDNIIS